MDETLCNELKGRQPLEAQRLGQYDLCCYTVTHMVMLLSCSYFIEVPQVVSACV